LHKLVASTAKEVDMPADRAHNRIRVIPFRPRRGSRRLVACSVCLRVREGGAWIEAGDLIRRLRTFELGDVVRLCGALCEGCEIELQRARRSGSEQVEA
jgi:hypothetical protein